MITLINPPGLKTFSGLQMHTPNPPLGLAYIAGTLREAKIPFHVIDATGEALDSVHPYPGRADFMIQGLTYDQILDRLPAETTMVGVGCMFSTLWPLSRMLAERIRSARPDIKLVLGGEHGTAVPEHVLRSSPYDVVVLGEGEEIFLNLLKAWRENTPLDRLKGIAFRDGDMIVTTGLAPRKRDIDAIPLPDWKSFPLEDYIVRNQANGINLGRSIPMLATRGCPYQCTFCSNPTMWTTRYIPRSPKLVVDEMEHWKKTYNITNFNFEDLTAIVKRSWAIEFCQELINRQLDIVWQMPIGTRSEVFDDEVARLIYQSGCRALAFAPESGSPEILTAINKRVDLPSLIEAGRIALRSGLKVSCFIVIGFPQDTPKTLNQTLSLVRRLAMLGIHDVAVTKFIPYPGSVLFRELQATGKLQLDDAFFVSPMDFYTATAPSYTEAVSARRLYWTMIWMFLNFYVISAARRPFRTLAILWRAIVHGTEETRYAKWFVDRFHTRRRWRKLQQGTSG